MGVVNSFLWGFWRLGLGALLGGFTIFRNRGIECVRERLWNNGFRSSLIVLRLWVGGMAFLCRSMPEIKERLFSACVFLLRVVAVIFFMVAN